MQEGSAIGLIVGHGNTKVVARPAQGPDMAAIFPSVAARAPQRGYESALAAGPATVRLDDEAWLVGDDALTFARSPVAILDRARYADASFVALARGALMRVLVHTAPDTTQPLVVMTGIPEAWKRDAGARTHLEEAIRRAAAPWGVTEVLVAPEAAGVYYAYVRQDERGVRERMTGMVGVLDIGFRDTNVALFADGRYVHGESVPGGVANGLREARALLSASYALELGLHDVDAALRRGYLLLDGRQHPVPPACYACITEGWPAIAGLARTLWPNGGRALAGVVLGGGGAHWLHAEARQTFPGCTVPFADLQETLDPEQVAYRVSMARPQLAGAVGFASVARAQLSARTGGR